MSTTENENNAEPDAPGGKQSGSQVLIGFCIAVLVLFAVMLNNPEQVAEWGSKLFGWQTPKQQCIQNLKYIDGAIQQWALENKERRRTLIPSTTRTSWPTSGDQCCRFAR